MDTQKIYFVVRRSSGEIAHQKAYFTAGDAKRALRCHFGSHAKNYAVASVESAPAIAWVIDDADKWAEVAQ